MFLNTTGLKKMIREAFRNNRLVLSRMGYDLMISDYVWILISDIDMIPNRITGAIIELAGELPEDGTCFRAGKGGNQQELAETVPWERMRSLKPGVQAEQTQVLIDVYDKILRVIKYNSDSFCVQKAFTDLVTNDELIEGKEEPAQGPYVFSLDENKALYWINHAGAFLACECRANNDWCRGLLDYCTNKEVGTKK